jgi:excisionase family DNA binding protein
MKAGELRGRVVEALSAAMQAGDSKAIARAADRAKAVGVALLGRPQDDEVDTGDLSLSTTAAASVLGYHPEHVRRLVRSGRLTARRQGGDYRLRVEDLWPILERRHRPPGRRRRTASEDAARAVSPEPTPPAEP